MTYNAVLPGMVLSYRFIDSVPAAPPVVGITGILPENAPAVLIERS